MNEIEAIVRSQAIAVLREASRETGLPYRYFTDHDGLLTVLDSISAVTASVKLREDDDGSSIAAHVEHLRFSIDATLKGISGDTAPADWAQSWNTSSVEEEEWKQLKSALREQFDAAERTVQQVAPWTEPSLGRLFALVAHVAYHIGTIQEKIRVVSKITHGG